MPEAVIRLKDIAREAGVSVMTVSKALRDAPDIAARTKAGDWFGNTELGETLQDADHFLRLYQRQREGPAELKSLLRSRVVKS